MPQDGLSLADFVAASQEGTVATPITKRYARARERQGGMWLPIWTFSRLFERLCTRAEEESLMAGL